MTSRKVRNASVRLAALDEAQLRKPPTALTFAGLPPAPTQASPATTLLVGSGVEVEHRLAATTIAVGPDQGHRPPTAAGQPLGA